MGKSIDLIKNKNFIVIGLGKTGISVIKKILGLSSSIIVLDNNTGLDLKSVLENIEPGDRSKLKIILGSGGFSEKKILEKINLVVLSPGVPGDIPLVKLAEKNKIPIWSELELAWRLLDNEEKKRTIAVTGTNGKTTVVTLIGEILSASGKNCVVCGNVGLPLIDTISFNNKELNPGGEALKKEFEGPVRIIEVSSFQLERTFEFKPFISVILNITSDHIDRHKTFKNYVNLKLRLLVNQDRNDRAVINMDDRFINSKIKLISSRRKDIPEFIGYSLRLEEGADIFYSDSHIFYNIYGEKGKINVENSLFKGDHNISNIIASAAVALLMGVNKKDIEKAVINFKPLSHRLEYLGFVRGIRCFNDSKSTNPDATVAALNDFGREVTLILGGRDKDMDFSGLINAINKKVKNLILIGESADRIYGQIIKYNYDYKMFKCETLEEAVEKGFEVTGQGEVLMLSPACASMDMFSDYKERGNKFKSLVFSKE